MKSVLALVFLFMITGAGAAEEAKTSLDQQLEQLQMPSNQLPGTASQDKLYSVQLRYVPIVRAHEISLMGSRDFNADGHLDANQVGLDYRYHFNDKWAIKFNYTRGFNELNKSGRLLLEANKLVPDSDYFISKADVGAEYNLFYGKFRLGSDKVFYFDQYVGLTAGMIELRRGTQPVAGVDTGFAFWLGKSGSLRLGLHNNFYQETDGLGQKALTRNMMGYLSLGLLLGGE